MQPQNENYNTLQYTVHGEPSYCMSIAVSAVSALVSLYSGLYSVATIVAATMVPL